MFSASVGCAESADSYWSVNVEFPHEGGAADVPPVKVAWYAFEVGASFCVYGPGWGCDVFLLLFQVGCQLLDDGVCWQFCDVDQGCWTLRRISVEG